MENEELRVVDILTDVGNAQGTVLSAYVVADATKMFMAEADGEVFVLMKLNVSKSVFDNVMSAVELRDGYNPTAVQMRTLGIDDALAAYVTQKVAEAE